VQGCRVDEPHQSVEFLGIQVEQNAAELGSKDARIRASDAPARAAGGVVKRSGHKARLLRAVW
jgi:hypothetical protein